MGRRLTLFHDTPLLLRRISGVPASPGEAGAKVLTGLLNLYEVVHVLLRHDQARAAEQAYQKYAPVAEGLSRSRIFEASRIRLQYPHRGLSYADAAGYATARELGAVFVTTDRGFEGLPGVRLAPT